MEQPVLAWMQYTISKYPKQNFHAWLKQNQPYTALLIWQHTTRGVQCMLVCSKELNFTVLYSLQICQCISIRFQCEKVQSKRVWTRVTFEYSHSTNLHVHHANQMMLIWRNTVEMSLNGTKYSRWPTAWACYMIVRSPALSLRYLFSSSVTVHSRIPISNFSKCASITCWTEQRNAQYFTEQSCVSFQSEYQSNKIYFPRWSPFTPRRDTKGNLAGKVTE